MATKSLAVCALAALALASFASGPSAQPTAEPRLIERALWEAAPLWRARLDAAPGFAIDEVRVLRRRVDGLTLLIHEQQPGYKPIVDQRVYVERRDATGGLLWRQPVPSLPSRFGAFRAAFAAGANDMPSLLVVTFLPAENRAASPFGSIVEIDESAGGFGTGPYQWWLAQQRLDGAPTACGSTTAGA